MAADTPDPATYRSVEALIRDHAEHTPDRVFLRSIDQGTSLTWGELRRLADRISAFLAGRGIGANDRVVVLSENALETLALYFAVLRHGATFCTVNVEVNAGQLREMVARLNPRLVLWQESLDPDRIGAGAPGEWIPFGQAAGDDGLFRMIAEMPEPDPPPSCLAGADDFAVISFTSGTAAAPKGVMHQYGNYFRIAEQSIAMWGLTGADRMLEYRSLSWASSHMLCLMPCLLVGAEILLARRFSQSRFFGWLREYRPTVAIGVPTVVNMLLERAADVRPEDWQSLRFMTCSTAPLMESQHRRFEDTYGIRLVQIYGMSEGGVVAGNPHDARRIGTVGLPGLYQNLRIVGPDGETLPDGATGEIEIGGAQTAFGYLLEDGTVERIRGERLRTGDLGFLDADGYLQVTGRAKDVIIRGGVNIAPMEIDNVLAAHPGIAEAATIGVPDAVYGEEAVSYVAPAAGHALDADGVIAHCRTRLAEFKLPRRILFVDAIPKNARGKIDRGALREDWTRRQQGAA